MRKSEGLEEVDRPSGRKVEKGPWVVTLVGVVSGKLWGGCQVSADQGRN